MNYSEIAAINVNEHIEKKNNLSYLSWAWAVDTLLRHDCDAFWEYGELHYMHDHTVMVYCTVHAFGRHRTAQLPVMDYKNKSVPNPDAVQVNVTMQRALVKAIALHGLGLYIYAGEDLPIEFKHEDSVDKPVDKSVDEPVVEEAVETAKEIVVPTSANEAAAVDWVCSFVNEFIPSVETVDSLRDFWKVNKSVLTRVEKFSKPMYQALEINFKERAVQLKGKA
jgi:hypothetical protein